MKTATYFHASLKPISRSAGRSVVAAAAYRTGSCIEDVRYGTVRDFSRKNDVVTSFTLAPAGAPDWARDAGTLWNEVEAKENRSNSTLAFEWEVALPNELSDAQREAIARRISGWLVSQYGVAVTTGIHSGGRRGNGMNDHMHGMMTSRSLTSAGWAKNKFRDFNCRKGQANPNVDAVKEKIAAFINDALSEAGSDSRVTHLSYAARGIPVEGTKHLGPAGSALARKVGGDRARINREIIEARILWQHEQAQEIDVATIRDLARRFGDDFDEVLEAAQAGKPVPDIEEHAKQNAQPMAADIAASGANDILPAPRGWRARMKAIAASVVGFFRDVTSDDPDTPRSWVSRVVETGRHMLHGWSKRDGAEMLSAAREAAALVHDISTGETSPAPQEGARPTADTQAQEAAKPAAGAVRRTGIGAAYADALKRSRAPDAATPTAPKRRDPDRGRPSRGGPDIE